MGSLVALRTADQVVTQDLRQLADGLRLGSVGSLAVFFSAFSSLLDSMRHSMVSSVLTRGQKQELEELLAFLMEKRARLDTLSAAAPGSVSWPAAKEFIIRVFEWNENGKVSQKQYREDLKDIQMFAALHRSDGGSAGLADFQWGGGGGLETGGFGGRGSGNDARKCYNCGKSGHISRFCPSKQNGKPKGGKGGRGGDNRTCFLCGQAGHLVANCPQRQAGGGGGGANAGGGNANGGGGNANGNGDG